MNKIKNLIRNFSIKNDRDFSRQLKWELLRYEIYYSQMLYSFYERPCKGKTKKITNLENQLKKLQISLGDANNLGNYDSIKNELDPSYDHVPEDMQIRSKCDWYEHGKKSAMFFFNLEKQKAAQNTIKLIYY